jgi:hypothetical protein
MREIAFSIPVSGVVRIDGDKVTITVNRADTTITMGEAAPGQRISLAPGVTLYDLVLEAAREVVRNKGANRFSAPELYSVARTNYPQLNRGSFMSRVIASAPNHPSYRHYSSKRDYLYFRGQGVYQLEDKYLKDTQGALNHHQGGLE